MGTVKKLSLTPRKRAQLELNFKEGPTPNVRMRCQIVLLKADGLTDKEIAQRVGCNPVTVSKWVKRYQIEGINGLAEKVWMKV